MNLIGPYIASPGALVKIMVMGVQGALDGYVVINGVRNPLRLTRLPHGLASIAVLIPSTAKGDILVRVSNDRMQCSHTILVV
ncbi:MAG: hypothetical protein V3W41_14365 [Planctomycetota bacterium]